MRYKRVDILINVLITVSCIVSLVTGLIGFYSLFFISSNIFDLNTLKIVVISISLIAFIASIGIFVLKMNIKIFGNFLKEAPLFEEINKFSYQYDIKRGCVNVSNELKGFLGLKKNRLPILEFKKAFEKPNLICDNYEDLVNNRSLSRKLKVKNGKYISLTLFANKVNNRKYIIGYVNDFTTEHIEEKNLLKAAREDSLTNTYRFSYFKNKVMEQLNNKKMKGALLTFDIDNFKNINDAYGHQYGDIVLMRVSEVCHRFCQGKNVLISRSGGDEFVLYYYGMKNYKEVEIFAKDLLESLKTISIPDVGLKYVYISLGISFFPFHSDNFEILQKYADDALYQSKTLPGSNFVVYDSDSEYQQNEYEYLNNENISDSVDCFKDLVLDEVRDILIKALKNNEIKIYLQPQVSLSRYSVSAESLCRWEKDNSILKPSDFLPYIERCGLSYDFDLYIFNRVLDLYNEYNLAKDNVILSVNQSIKTLISPNYQKDFEDIFIAHNIPKNVISVEITEKSLFSSMRIISKAINLYHRLGIIVSIDDFGTGFTSLQIIKDLNIDYLKIDKSFIQAKDGELNKCIAIIHGICEMAKIMKIETVIEGVENIEQLKIVDDSGVEYIQGFIVSKAVPFEEFVGGLKSKQYANIVKELKNNIK